MCNITLSAVIDANITIICEPHWQKIHHEDPIYSVWCFSYIIIYYQHYAYQTVLSPVASHIVIVVQDAELSPGIHCRVTEVPPFLSIFEKHAVKCLQGP